MEAVNTTILKAEEKENQTESRAIALSNPENIKSKYGEVYEISTTVDVDDENEGRKLVYYFKKPSTAFFSRYLKTAGKNMVTSPITFVLDNIANEQIKQINMFKKECDKYPGLALGQKLLTAIGLGDKVNFRKL